MSRPVLLRAAWSAPVACAALAATALAADEFKKVLD